MIQILSNAWHRTTISSPFNSICFQDTNQSPFAALHGNKGFDPCWLLSCDFCRFIIIAIPWPSNPLLVSDFSASLHGFALWFDKIKSQSLKSSIGSSLSLNLSRNDAPERNKYPKHTNTLVVSTVPEGAPTSFFTFNAGYSYI